jgi:ABC-2 type transport system permease protein
MSGSSFSVAMAVLRRVMIQTFKNPAIIIPSLAFPLVFLIAFAGGLSTVASVPGFSFKGGYTAFQFVFVFLQTGAFAGIFTGYRIAEDYESGFARRLLIAAPHSRGIVLGFVLSGLLRFALTGVILWGIALLAGMTVLGSPIEILAMWLLAGLLCIASTLWVSGLAFRFQSVDIGSFMQTPVFILLFLAPVYVPLALLAGWLKIAASANPVTAIIDASRGFISGEPTKVALAFGLALGLAALMGLWAGLQLRRAQRGVA